MGVHGRTFVGKTTSQRTSSTTLNTPRNKRTIVEINSQLKNIPTKSSTSQSTAAAGTRTNASSNVDINMAPALTEPLSPTEKLSTSGNSVMTPDILLLKKDVNTDVQVQDAQASSTSRASPQSVNQREKRSSSRNIPISTRVTRSRDSPITNATSSGLRNSPLSIAPSIAGVRKSKIEQTNDTGALVEPMLSAATPTQTPTTTTTEATKATNEATNEATEANEANEATEATEATETPTTNEKETPATSNNNNNNNNNNIVCKDSTTEQLLADLTTDLEETITAEICLRKQLPEVKVSTPDASQLSSVVVAEAADTSVTPDTTVPGDSKETTESISKNVDENIFTEKDEESPIISTEDVGVAKESDQQTVDSTVNDMEPVVTAAELPASQQSSISSSTAAVPNEDLPPINSDSTMTASEEEETEELDALEARLSQLDGTAEPTAAPTAAPTEAPAATPIITTDDAANNVTLTPSTSTSPSASGSAILITTSSPPPAQQSDTPTQLLLTPIPIPVTCNTQQLLLTPTSSSSQMLALTPQSTSSLLREIGATVSSSGEIEDQELEEVLKVLKGLDAHSTSADTAGLDLNVLFNEVYTSFNCDDIGSQPQQQLQQQPQHLQNFIPSAIIATTSVPASLPSSSSSLSYMTKVNTVCPLKETQSEIEEKQQVMQKKVDTIIRRLRKLQVRYMSKHTTEEIAGLFELTARLTNKESSSSSSSCTNSQLTTQAKSVISARPPAHSWEEDIKQPVPASQVLNLLNRLETSANALQLCTTASSSNNLPTYSAPTISSTQQQKRPKKLGETSNSSLVATTVADNGGAGIDAQKTDEIVPTFKPHVVDELAHVAGMLKTEMRDVQTAYDSDATESSSGGESADEMVAYNNQVQQSLSIVKRAAWRYSRERASIASRWSWLLSQIADLEIKIRQHGELYQEVVRTKGAVVCEEELENKTTMSRQKIMNAYGEIEEEIALQGASRTRGYVPSHFRKRKLLQTTQLHTISKKASRPSTIKCGCQWPLNPCALCTGRIDPTAPRDLPDTMMLSDRVSLLDPGYHPVLSFPEDVNNSIHIEAIARTSSWQQRIVRIQPKSVARCIWKAEREAANLSNHSSSRKFGDVLLPTQKRRYVRRKERNVNVLAESGGGGGVGGVNSSSHHDAFSKGAITATTTTPMPQSTIISNVKLIDSTSLSSMGNGTANLFTSTSTTSTTPFGANKLTTTTRQMIASSKKMHCHLVGDGVLLEPLSPNKNNNSSSSNRMSEHQIPPQNNFEPYNPNHTHSSLISNHLQQQQNNNTSNLNNSNNNKKGKHRKSLGFHHHQNYNSNTTGNHNFQHNNQNNYNNNNNNNSSIQQYQQSYTNGDITSDYWDGSFGGRSRTASPTHGSSSNYHKYERSLERRNRISYDIDNIVIPYSVAAATRVEILPYKEIPTPKWRLFDEDAEVCCEEPDDQNSIEASEIINNVKSEVTQEEDVYKKEIPPLENDTKEQPSAANIPADIAEMEKLVKKIEREKEIEEEVLKAQAMEEGLSTNNKSPLAEKELQSEENKEPAEVVKTCDKVSKEEPPTKRIKISTDSIESISVASSVVVLKQEDEESLEAKAKLTSEMMNDSGDSQDKEQILFADLEEDISDETFVLRHERALNEERRKFQTYLKFPWSTRSRANRRIDSRAESSGANTPDPASPAPNTPSLGGGDQESIPSPLAPSTPITPLDTINETPESGSHNVSSAHSSCTIAPPAFPISAGNLSKRNERRRTTSTKALHTERNERRSLTPDSREVPTVPPYEPMNYPLNDEMFEMLSSVTLLPPSVSTYFGDDYKDDFNSFVASSNLRPSTSSSARYNRRSSSIRNEFIQQRSLPSSKNCGDVNGKRRRNNRRNNIIIDMANHQVAESSDATKYLPYVVNGKQKKLIGATISTNTSTRTTNSTDLDDDTEDIDDYGDDYYNDMMLVDDDDEDDGYSKHPLAPGNDIDNFIDHDGGYDAYMGVGNSNSLLGVSETESEVDPFEDDDPNDPEWKGEPRSERPERFRKRS